MCLPARKDGWKGTIEMYLKWFTRLRIRRAGCIMLVYTPSRIAAEGMTSSCCFDCGGSCLERPNLPGPRFSGDCQLWLLNVQSAMNPTYGGRITDCGTSFCEALAWCPCAAISVNTASSGFVETSIPDPLRLSLCLPLPGTCLGAGTARKKFAWRTCQAWEPFQLQTNPISKGQYLVWASHVERAAGTAVQMVAPKETYAFS